MVKPSDCEGGGSPPKACVAHERRSDEKHQNVKRERVMTENTIKIAAIVAMANNRCIGKNNDMPWYIPEDFKHFKAKTLGKPIIMGRKTFQSIIDRNGKPLPKRQNIVISRTGYDYDHPDVIICASLDIAIETAKSYAQKNGIDEIIIGGGAQIYALALPVTDKYYLTEVDMHVDGDAFLMELSTEQWEETHREPHNAEPSYSFCEYTRKK